MLRTIENKARWIMLGTILVTVVWNVALNTWILPNQFFKTEVEVISIQSVAPSTYRGGRQTNSFPTYRYVDDKGALRTFESKDGYNWINGVLFKKEVGQKVIGYYEKGSKEGLFITETGDWWTFRLMPILFSLFIFGIPTLIIFILARRIPK